MPSFRKHTVSKSTKLLLVGDSGAGKTATLATLANAGYNVRILDFDNGLDILSSYLNDDAVDRVHYETLRDDLKKATAFAEAIKLINDWKTDDVDFGPVANWTEKDVLVIDSMTMMGTSALKAALQKSGNKMTDQPSQPQWGEAMRNVENIIQYLTSDSLKCNVIFTSHIHFQEDASGASKGYPSVVGSKLPTIISRYFNCVMRLDVKPSKSGGQRVLRTVSDFRMNLKNTAPKLIEPEIEPDLAHVIKAIQDNAKNIQGK